MATKYVRKSGSDSNGGTSPSDAWLTIGKALGASGIASGDVLYIGAGIYREAVTVAMTSATAETIIHGDVDGSHTGDAGEVQWTAYTTDDVTAPSTSSTCFLQGRDFLTFRNICFVGGNLTTGDCIRADTATSTNITFEDCTFEGTGQGAGACVMNFTNSGTTAFVLRVRRCQFLFILRGIQLNAVASASADYDIDVLIENCTFYAFGRDAAIRSNVQSATNTFGGGGEIVRYCSYYGASTFVQTTDASHADGALAAKVNECLIVSGSAAALNAQTSGHISADWNYYYNNTANTNVTDGGNSYGPSALTKRRALSFGQERVYGANPRPFGTPLSGSPLLGFHNNASVPSVDGLNRIRPAGGSSATAAVGPFERHDTAISPGTTVGADSGTGYIELVGVGDHDFDVPVDAAATVLNIKVKTSGYSGTNYPQMLLVNGGQCGVADQTINATSASASAYETLSTASFTPTAKGIVTVRLTNRSANGTGIAAFDTFSVS